MGVVLKIVSDLRRVWRPVTERDVSVEYIQISRERVGWRGVGTECGAAKSERSLFADGLSTFVGSSVSISC